MNIYINKKVKTAVLNFEFNLHAYEQNHAYNSLIINLKHKHHESTRTT